MDLTTRLKQKNDQLLVKGALLQQQLSARANTPDFRLFFLTFVVAPFILGAAVRLLPGNAGLTTRQVSRAFFLGLKFWPMH